MAKFQTGQTKPGNSGRSKGTPNRKTLLLKSLTDELGIDIPRRLGEVLPQLELNKQVDVLLELMGYVYPKRKAIEHSGPDGEPIAVTAHRDISKVAGEGELFEALLKIDAKLQAPKSDSE